MARRIRSIKPEILDDAVTAALPHLDWRLFVSLWLMADDYGNLHGHAAQVKGAALWATPDSLANVRESLARLSDASLIRCYTVRGQPYIAICGWAKHQKVDHPGKAVIPGPGQADSATCDVSRESRESLANPREVLATDQDHGPGPRTVDHREREARPATPAASLATGTLPGIAPVKPKRDRKPAAIALPADFAPAESHRTFAATNGIDLDREVERFRLHHEAKGSTFASWNAALGTWLRNAVDFRGARAGPSRNATPPASSIDATAQALRERGFIP